MNSHRAKRSQAQRLRRRTEPEEIRQERLANQAVRQAQHRSSMTPEETTQSREANRHQQVEHRARMTPEETTQSREANRQQHVEHRARMTPEEHEHVLEQRRMQPGDGDDGQENRFRANQGLNYCSNPDDALVRACRMREEIDANNDILVDEALTPIGEEEEIDCLENFARNIDGICPSRSGKVVIGDHAPVAENHPRVHAGCAICGIRCVGEFRDEDAREDSSVLLPNWRLLSVADLQLFHDGLYVIAEEDVDQYRQNNTLTRRAIVRIQGSQTYLKLQRRYLQQEHTTTAADTLEVVVPPEALAYVCTFCVNPSATARGRASQRQQFVLRFEPGLLGRNGIPIGLPELSTLQKVLITRVRFFSHVLKIVVNTGATATMAGHTIAMPTNAAEQSALVSQVMPVVPSDGENDTPIISVCFIGPMERLQTILHANVGELMPHPIRLLRHRFLDSHYQPIRLWLLYLRQCNRHYNDIIIVDDANTINEIEQLGQRIWERGDVLDGRAEQQIEEVLHREAQPNVDPVAPEPEDQSAPNNADENAEDGDVGHTVENDRVLREEISMGHTLLNVAETNAADNTHVDSQFFQRIIGDVQRGQTMNAAHRDGPGAASFRTTVQHGTNLLNEYENMDFILSCGFPMEFPHGYIDDQRPMPQKLLQLFLLQADNRFSDDSSFVFYIYNQQRRAATAQGVSLLWRRDPSCLERLRQVLSEPTIEQDLQEAARNPSGEVAKRLKRIFIPLVVRAGGRVPYGNSGASERAMAEMLAMQRFIGPSSWFFTYNPVMRDIPLALNLASVVGDNWTPETREYLRWSTSARSEHLEKHPVGAVLGYILVRHNLYKYLLRIPFPIPGSSSKTSLVPPIRSPQQSQINPGPHRDRGLLGAAHGAFDAQESSTAGNMHGHARVHCSLMNWRLIRKLCLSADRNREIGMYLSSIQSSSILDLSPALGWGMKTLPWHPPLLPFARKDDSHDQITLDNIFNGDQGSAEFDARLLTYTKTHKQYHFPHNASCFKYKRSESAAQTRCRFSFPPNISNNQSGIYQAKLVEIQDRRGREDARKAVLLLNEIEDSAVPPVPFENLGFKQDQRCLLYVPYRPSLDEIQHSTREHRDGGDEAQVDEQSVDPVRPVTLPGEDTSYRPEDLAKQGSENNQWYVDNVAGITATNIGQNNCQFESPNGMGTKSYTCKYVAKGDGSRLTEIVSLLYNAYKESEQRPSVHSDASTNPHRRSLRVLNRVVNNNYRMSEVGIKQALSSLLQLQQFECSHRLQYVHGSAALKNLLREQGPSEADPSLSDGRDDTEADESFTEDDVGRGENVFFFEALEEEEVGELAHADQVPVPQDADSQPQAESQQRQQRQQRPMMVVSQAYHYRHRPVELEHYSLSDFACLTRMVDIERDMDAATHRRTHPQANLRFDLPRSHVQSHKKQVQLVTDAAIPMFTGAYIPQCPPWSVPLELQRDQPAAHRLWENRWKQFGSLMVTLFSPWRTDTGRPAYSLDREGFEAFYSRCAQGIESGDTRGGDDDAARRRRNMQENEPPLREYEDEIRASRKLSIDNIVAAQYASSEVSKVETVWRRQRSHTAAEAQRLPRGLQHNIDEEPHRPRGVRIDNDIEDDSEIYELVDELRELFDLVETSPLSTKGRQHVKDSTVVDDVFAILGLHRQRDLSNVVNDHRTHGEERVDADAADGEALGFPTINELNETPPPLPVNERLHPHILASHACGVVINFGLPVRTQAVVADDDAPPGVDEGDNPPRTLLARQFVRDIEALKAYAPSRSTATLGNRGHVGEATAPNQSSDWERISRTLNADQLRAAQALVAVAGREDSGCQILQLWHGAAGCGKTYLMNAVRSLFGPNECVVTAFSGKAACLHELGVTSHSLFGLPITNAGRPPIMTEQRRINLRAKLDTVRIIFIDEISMLPSWLLSVMNHILQDLYGNQLRGGSEIPLFGGYHIILAGHFLQLPAVGASNLMQAAIATPQRDVDSHMGAGRMFRQFQRFSLSIPQRSSNDLSLGTFLRLCESPLLYPRPFATGILQPTCANCALPDENVDRPTLVSQRQFRRRATPRDHPPPAPNDDNLAVCPPNCPHRCQHLKVLNNEDVLSDPAWRRCYFTSPMNSSCDSWTRARLDDYAHRGEVVLRWRLLPVNSSSAVAGLLNEEVDDIYGLWGYYLHKGPVCMTYNVNVPAGIGHHTEGQLVGIALEEDTLHEIDDIVNERHQNGVRGGSVITLSKPPIAVLVRMTLLHNQASQIPTSGFIPRRNEREPPVITLPQGSTLTDQNVSARKMRVSLGEMPSAVALDPALRSGSMAGRNRRTQQLTVDVIGTGYRMNFASTVHGLQGATVQGKLIADLNSNPAQRSSITVSGAYVTLSRVQTFEDIRVVPWQNGYSHLQALEHSREYVLWEQCYDADGHFDIQRLRPNEDLSRQTEGGAPHQNAGAVTPAANPATTESGMPVPAAPTTPRSPRQVSFQPLHQILQSPSLGGLSRNRNRNSTARGRAQSSSRTSEALPATPIARPSTVTPSHPPLRSQSSSGRTQSSSRTSGALPATPIARPSTVTPSHPPLRSQSSSGRTQSSLRVAESSRPSLRSSAAVTYSNVFVPFLLQVFYPSRRPTANQGRVIDAINNILEHNAVIQSLNEQGYDLNWNALVGQVRGRLRDMIGQEMFSWVRETLVPPEEYIEAIPQEVLLGNLFRVDGLSLHSGFREVAERIQQSIDNRGDQQNPLRDASMVLDMACQVLPLEMLR